MTKSRARRQLTQKAASIRPPRIDERSSPRHEATPFHPLLQLQHSIGNRAVARIIKARIQRTGAADARERSADQAAHQLTHPRQPRQSGVFQIQRNFEADFAGKKDVPVEPNIERPRGTVRVQTYGTQTEAPRWVYAPYGIYSPSEVPEKWQDRIMMSSKAGDWQRRLTDKTFEQFIEDYKQRGENQSELTVRDMRKLAEGAWPCDEHPRHHGQSRQ